MQAANGGFQNCTIWLLSDCKKSYKSTQNNCSISELKASEHLVILWLAVWLIFCPIILSSYTFHMHSKPRWMWHSLNAASAYFHQHLGTVLQIKIFKCFTFGNVDLLKLLSTIIYSYINSAVILDEVAAKSWVRWRQPQLKDAMLFAWAFLFSLSKVLISWT